MAVAVAQNIGPVTRAEIPIPESGGVVVFRGRNGSGKSTMLNAIDAAVGNGKAKVPVRDGALKAEFEGFGVRLTVGRSTRRTGEAEVHTLEGRLSVADLVDPGLADPERADAHRIRALIALVQAKADPSLFHPLVGGPERFDAIVTPAAMAQPDLVAMAGAVKRDIEAASRKYAATAENSRNKAIGFRRSTDGIDMTADHDGDKLQAELEAAIAAKAEVEADHKNAATAIAAANKARERLATIEANSKGLTLEQAVDEERKAIEFEALCQSQVQSARAALAAAIQAQQQAELKLRYATNSRMTAEEHAKAMASAREQIDAAADLDPPNPADITRAKVAAEMARERIEQGAVVRQAIESTARAEALDEQAAQQQAEADLLRDAARSVDDVLSSVVAKSGVPLRVEPVDQRMRLVIDTVRGRTCFGELSDGERWRIALDIAIQAVGQGGEITIPQSAWEGLDPSARQQIAARLRESGVIAYTAEAASGELRAEVYGEAA